MFPSHLEAVRIKCYFFGFTIDIWTTSNHMVNFFRMTNAKALDNKERGPIVVQG